MSSVQTEHVLVVPTDLFRSCGYFEGFCSDIDRYLGTLLEPANTRYMSRDLAEDDPSFKQLIPYCIFQFTDADGNTLVYQYTRGSGQGEARLHAKRSVGIGGHISTLDDHGECVYQQGMQRELDEEVSINTEYEGDCVGLINDDQNDVGKVPLGVVHLFKGASPDVTSREDDIALGGFVPTDEIMKDIEHFETWSQICLRALYA